MLLLQHANNLGESEAPISPSSCVRPTKTHPIEAQEPESHRPGLCNVSSPRVQGWYHKAQERGLLVQL